MTSESRKSNGSTSTNITNTPISNGTDHSNQKSFSMYPDNVGILAMEVYFPAQYVDQQKLEKFDKVSAGKYTIGLGQSKMSFCLDNEDINSICLTVLNNLLEKYSISPNEIGRLDVGTETLIDKSKSIKSTLMSLFIESGNTDIEGVDNVNACFGGTAAIFNAVNWIESSYWDGRYAIVVMGDIAVYAKGSARPTGGAGSIAFLIGPNAPLVFERGLRSTHISHAYDFYKPVMDSEYPIVDGKLSVVCYLNALDKCYQMYKKKFKMGNKHRHDLNNNNGHSMLNGERKRSKPEGITNCNGDLHGEDEFNLNSAQAFLFHSPYCKLVQKSFARLLWNDYLEVDSAANKDLNQVFKTLNCETDGINLEKFKKLTNEESFLDKDLEKELVRLSNPLFNKKTSPSLLFAKEIGNMYTPSLYGCLASYLLSKTSQEHENSRICLFSYGSGLASSMFSLIVTETSNERFTLNFILKNLSEQKTKLLENRVEIEPHLYDAYLQQREVMHKKVPREAQFKQNTLYEGTWNLKNIDANYRRFYERTSNKDCFDKEKVLTCLNEELSKFVL